MKTCTVCKESKPLHDFHNSKTGKFGKHSICKICRKPQWDKYNAENAEKKRAYQKQYYRDNIENCLAYQKEYRAYSYTREHNLKAKFGLTLEQYDALRNAQDNKCACCGKTLIDDVEKSAGVVDHDHNCCPGKRTCGKCIRGIICANCNGGIGFLGDSIEGVRNALVYLESYAAKEEKIIPLDIAV